MIFQNPMSALNPVMTIGEQVQEGLNAHEKGMTRVARKQRVLELLEALKRRIRSAVTGAIPMS